MWPESMKCGIHIYEDTELEEKPLEKVLKLPSFDFYDLKSTQPIFSHFLTSYSSF